MGTGAKPWRQKGTGRARVGSRRNPVWRGGGIAFGPVPRDYRKAMSKKARRAALRSALLAKLRDGEIKVVTDLRQSAPKTKDLASTLRALGAPKNCLLVLLKHDENAWKSARNLPGVDMSPLPDLNAYAALRRKTIIMTKDAFTALPEEMK
ncbi:MAG: 50S ribosomal protein L4 [Planctomycetota bacterium]